MTVTASAPTLRSTCLGLRGPASATQDGRPPRINLSGINLIRAIAVIAVLYSHISYYLVDDLHTNWWGIDFVSKWVVQSGGLNQHLSFLGVAMFMTLTGLLLTGSAARQSPGRFMINRIGRLLPLFWVAIAVAVVLVRLGINGMFSPQSTVTDGQAAWSFVLGGFFMNPQVLVLQVAWTLVVQILFYLYVVAAAPLLRRVPVLVPLLGAAMCTAILLTCHYFDPNPAVPPTMAKVAGTLPLAFMGQIIYLGWVKLADWRWIVIASLAQVGVVKLASDLNAYGAGVDSYLWTVVVVVGTVLLLSARNGFVARSAIVRWIATRSYAIYLLQTLVLYRVYDETVQVVGKTGAIVAFLVVTGLVSEAGYRWIEVPCARLITKRVNPSREAKPKAETPAPAAQETSPART